jgi:hypothetical protein
VVTPAGVLHSVGIILADCENRGLPEAKMLVMGWKRAMVRA